MKESLIIIYVAVAILLIMAFVGGSNMILQGLNISITTAYRSFLMLLASFIIIGQFKCIIDS